MMGPNYFLGWTEEELLAERKKWQKNLVSSVVSANGGDGGVSMRQNMSPQSAIHMIEAALYALDSTKYAALADNAPVTQTSISFSQSPYA